MKKTIASICLIALLLGLSACNNDNDDVPAALSDASFGQCYALTDDYLLTVEANWDRETAELVRYPRNDLSEGTVIASFYSWLNIGGATTGSLFVTGQLSGGESTTAYKISIEDGAATTLAEGIQGTAFYDNRRNLLFYAKATGLRYEDYSQLQLIAKDLATGEETIFYITNENDSGYSAEFYYLRDQLICYTVQWVGAYTEMAIGNDLSVSEYIGETPDDTTPWPDDTIGNIIIKKSDSGNYYEQYDIYCKQNGQETSIAKNIFGYQVLGEYFYYYTHEFDFENWGSYSKVYRCKLDGSDHIDLGVFEAGMSISFYQGKQGRVYVQDGNSIHLLGENGELIKTVIKLDDDDLMVANFFAGVEENFIFPVIAYETGDELLVAIIDIDTDTVYPVDYR